MKDINISSSYLAFHFLGYSGKCKEMEGYFRQCVDQVLTKFGAGEDLLVRPFLCLVPPVGTGDESSRPPPAHVRYPIDINARADLRPQFFCTCFISHIFTPVRVVLLHTWLIISI